MTTITNGGKRRLGLSGRPSIVLDAGETQEISATQFHSLRENKTTMRWMDSGLLTVQDPPEKHDDSKLVLKKPAVKQEEYKDELPQGITGVGVELHKVGRGWYTVYVNGFAVTDGKVRKDEAESIALEYK